jgi:hypothetical protein
MLVTNNYHVKPVLSADGFRLAWLMKRISPISRWVRPSTRSASLSTSFS